ncbi:mucin TcMUCII, putative [Trypanosoma cruzi marinkellei]|uniref:Mucin TcMUCII, putative n=1 Tax=Trypanosoma cruzi marinkellei TaxID=85056 RepID=K2M720_TRYCR|nr:mucin TcMUCII, putative [Trypanosoma cruzi marinkellei]
MMTTCRLLCALLVLALCCCPSVCVAEGDAEVTDNSRTLLIPEPPVTGVSGQANTFVTSSSTGLADPLPAPGGKADAQMNPGPGTVTVVSDGQGGGTPERPRNDTEQPNGTSGLQLAAGPPKSVQQEAEITETSGSMSESESSKEHKATEEKQSEASGPRHVPPEDPVTPSLESVTKEEPSRSEFSISEAGTVQTLIENQTPQRLSSGHGTIQKPTKKDTVQKSSEKATKLSEKNDVEEPTSGTTSDNGNGTSTTPALPEDSDKTTRPTNTEQGRGGSANPMAQIGTNSTVTVQSQEETVPNTTTTTTAPEAPTTTTTGAPSRPREIDGSLSSSAWVCAPLLLALSALAYTTLG